MKTEKSSLAEHSRSKQHAKSKISTGASGTASGTGPTITFPYATEPNDIVQVRYAVADLGDETNTLMVELRGGSSLSKKRWSTAELADVLLEAAAGLEGGVN